MNAYLGSIARHITTMLAGVLVAHGLLEQDQAGVFSVVNGEVLVGVTTYAIAQIFSLLKSKK